MSAEVQADERRILHRGGGRHGRFAVGRQQRLAPEHRGDVTRLRIGVRRSGGGGRRLGSGRLGRRRCGRRRRAHPLARGVGHDLAAAVCADEAAVLVDQDERRDAADAELLAERGLAAAVVEGHREPRLRVEVALERLLVLVGRNKDHLEVLRAQVLRVRIGEARGEVPARRAPMRREVQGDALARQRRRGRHLAVLGQHLRSEQLEQLRRDGSSWLLSGGESGRGGRLRAAGGSHGCACVR
mmetsp:Transcript_21008/g.55236  ORF Transcript_21008/g.55236 Transcript_21008/m.55236 type:complete len:242 (-) Transcript_21008:70-795(-)|eukprot:7376043-Prymnesium_polylepis.2